MKAHLAAAAVVAAAATAVAGVGNHTEARADDGRQQVAGTWQSLVNCAITSYNPVSRHLTCVGSSLWQGAWNGVTQYDFKGTFDPVSGNVQGTLDETFDGSSSGGGRGSMSFVETLTIDGATSQLHINAHIIDGTGDFEHARGDVSFDGFDNAVTGNGTYSGWWIHG